MSVHRFEAAQRFPVALEEAWAFFSDPRNLGAITPPDMRFQMLGEPPPRAYAGLIVVYRVRPLLGIPVTWVTEITVVDEPHMFVDEQRLGPYRLWHHEHHLRAVADAEGGAPSVEMRDIVHYALPFGALGDLLDRLVVRRRIEAIFAFRRRVLAQRFGAPAHT